MLPSKFLENHREKIRKVVLFLRVINVREYGSVIYHTDAELSDLDFLIDPIHETFLMDIGAIRYELKQLLDIDVDVLTPNSGDLYDDLMVEELMSNHYESKTRNKLIALMFKECGLIEKYGSGIDRFKRLCKEHGLMEPVFKEMQKGLKVIVYKQSTQKTTREAILLLLKENPKLTRNELAKQLSVTPDTIKQQLARLKKTAFWKELGVEKKVLGR